MIWEYNKQDVHLKLNYPDTITKLYQFSYNKQTNKWKFFAVNSYEKSSFVKH